MSFLATFTLLLPYVVAAIIAFFAAARLLRDHRSVPGRIHLGAMMLAVGMWACFNFLEDGSISLRAKLVYTNLEYLCVAFVPVLLFRFSYIFSEKPGPRFLNAMWFRISLLVIPIATLILVWFDPSLGLVRHNFGLAPNGPFVILTKTYSVGFYIFMIYSYVLLLLSALFWIHGAVKNRVWIRFSSLAVLVAFLLPWIANFLYIARIDIWPGHDPTPAAFSAMGFLLLYSISRFRFLVVLPLAGDVLLRTWNVPLFVFDQRGILAYFNHEAERLWTIEKTSLGQDRAKGIPGLSWLQELPADGASRKTTLQIERDGQTQYWEANERRFESYGRILGSVITLHDVTELEVRVQERTRELEELNKLMGDELQYRKRTEQQLFYYSLHDPLTGLANRSLLLSRLGQTLDRHKRNPEAVFGIILINFTGFKTINDNLGHHSGDEFLRQTGQRLLQALRSVDTIARYSNDEFVILLDTVSDEAKLQEVAERLLSEVETPLMLNGTSVMPSGRMGTLLGSESYETPEELIRDTEIAMNRAASAGPGSIVQFDHRYRDDLRDRLQLQADLAKAIIDNQLYLVYQPIIDLGTGKIRGFEALSRWKHPTRGEISPGVFIPIAEASGTVKPLGLWVLRESARFFTQLAQDFPESRDTFVAVNISPQQLVEPDFPEIVRGVLGREGLPLGRLSLEITETALVENSESLIPILQAIRREGIGTKLDDFGTGYSSLHYLHRLPVDTLKIDRSFITDLHLDETAAGQATANNIVRIILLLSRELGLDVIAEGIELEAQVSMLRQAGCAMGQGFYFSKGVTATEVRKLFS